MPAVIKRKRVVVSGRVQGVGYRYFCQNRAASLGLSGWVRNLPDGDVELEAQGEAVSLDQFLQSLHQGPQLSRVNNVFEQDMTVSGSERGFSVRY